jgi:hypothetical protein
MPSPRRVGDFSSPTRPTVSTNERPSLLPAFEPLSSSPLPGPSKTASNPAGRHEHDPFYPTPVPTSETGLLSSSPHRGSRPGMMPRTVSELSKRAPLAEVPELEVPSDGHEVLLGRSALSADFQFSTSTLVSRVHIKVLYKSASPDGPWGKIVVTCLGWNGAYVHYSGEARKIEKNESFTAVDPLKDIMVDVCDSRVFILWPSKIRDAARIDDDTVECASESGGSSPTIVRNSSLTDNPFVSSPPASPPFANASIEMVNDENDPNALPLQASATAPVQVYEDSEEPELRPLPLSSSTRSDLGKRKRSPIAKQPPLLSEEGDSDVEHLEHEGESDEEDSGDEAGNSNEENDPTVFSFGPAGFNITNRFASFSATESLAAAMNSQPSKSSRPGALSRQISAFSDSSSSDLSSVAENMATDHSRSPANNLEHGRPTTPTNKSKPVFKTPTPTSSRSHRPQASPIRRSPSLHVPESPIRNHVVNQLAYSRLHSMPLSAIFGNLPTDMKTPSSLAADKAGHGLTSDKLRVILHNIPCVGEIMRSGKDAAGKTLEDEYYYVAEMDSDEMRRQAVQGSIGGTGLRAARRSHKVCSGLWLFWPRRTSRVVGSDTSTAILLEAAACMKRTISVPSRSILSIFSARS